MVDENNNNLWPMPKFYFSFTYGPQGGIASFQEVSGLDT